MNQEIKTKIQTLVKTVDKLCDKNKQIEELQAEIKELANIGIEILESDDIPANSLFSSLAYDLDRVKDCTYYIDNDDVLRYSEERFTYSYDQACKNCNGTGVLNDPGTPVKDCETCNGEGVQPETKKKVSIENLFKVMNILETEFKPEQPEDSELTRTFERLEAKQGKIECKDCHGAGSFPVIEGDEYLDDIPCINCNGNGYFGTIETCQDCGGTGFIVRDYANGGDLCQEHLPCLNCRAKGVGIGINEAKPKSEPKNENDLPF